LQNLRKERNGGHVGLRVGTRIWYLLKHCGRPVDRKFEDPHITEGQLVTRTRELVPPISAGVPLDVQSRFGISERHDQSIPDGQTASKALAQRNRPWNRAGRTSAEL